MNWYQHWAGYCDNFCRVPLCYAAEQYQQQILIVLEDLDAAGFPLRKSTLTLAEIKRCLHWLANFHARFLGKNPGGLWPVGTYWHLETRPDEWAVMDDKVLQDAASAIDQRLSSCQYQTLVHGDAKLANFCFSNDGQSVAVVDFQYVGGGCGMKDVAYFLGSCLDDEECESLEQELLAEYFSALQQATARIDGLDWDALEQEWRALFAVAWTDFYRFLSGWMPGHWKINRYSKKLAKQALGGL